MFGAKPNVEGTIQIVGLNLGSHLTGALHIRVTSPVALGKLTYLWIKNDSGSMQHGWVVTTQQNVNENAIEAIVDLGPDTSIIYSHITYKRTLNVSVSIQYDTIVKEILTPNVMFETLQIWLAPRTMK